MKLARDGDDARRAALEDWLSRELGRVPGEMAPISSDASFRRYFRLTGGGRSLIAMDAPPEREPVEPFLRVAALLAEAGLHAPAVLAADRERGFVLLTDLGRRAYLDALREGDADVDALIGDAIDALVRWQVATRPGGLPDYDRQLLQAELDLFWQWYVRSELGLEPTGSERRIWDASCAALVDRALGQPKVYVHRDFMPRNLIVSDPNPGVIDFQDAVLGPVTYDMVSLLRDAFISWDEERVVGWAERYRRRARSAGVPVPADAETFRRDFDWMGVQRHLKVLGIFARLSHRDGKPAYLDDAPRFHDYIRTVCRRYDELAPLVDLIDRLQDRARASAS